MNERRKIFIQLIFVFIWETVTKTEYNDKIGIVIRWRNKSSEKIVINFLQFPFTHAKRAAIVINFLVQRFDWNKNVYQTELSKC